MADRDEVEALRGRFCDGYTPEDVDEVLGLLSEWTGLDLVASWEYFDEDGPGGGSDIHVRDGDRLLWTPDEVDAFLDLWGDGEHEDMTVDDLLGLKPGSEAGVKAVPNVRHGNRNLCSAAD